MQVLNRGFQVVALVIHKQSSCCCLLSWQVLNKGFEVVALVARSAPAFSKRDALYCIDGLAEKVHELKHK